MSRNTDDFNHVQYCSSNSVVVINPVGRLKQVYTPFRVTQMTADGRRRWLIVDEVRSTKEDKLVYVINGTAYFHHYFSIDVQF